MPRNFFCCERKNKENGTLFIPKNSGGKKLQLFTKRKIMLGDDFEFVQKIERNP